MRTLVTGATGFTGKYIVKKLIDSDNYVLCIVRNKDKCLDSFSDEYISRLSYLEIKEPENLMIDDYIKIIEKYDIDTIIHNAALAREYSIDKEEYFQTNVLWTKNLALSFLQSNVRHNKFIYISSVGVYGTIPTMVPAKETTPYNPDGKYHISKMMAEKELINIRTSQGLPLAIIRPSVMYGIGDYGFVYKLFKLTSKGIFPLNNDGYKVHLLDLETFAEAIEMIAENVSRDGFIYNISDKYPVEMKVLLEFIKKNISGNYIRLPSFIFYILRLIGNLNLVLSIKFKLISNTWSYDVSLIERDTKIELNETTDNLEKYMNFYRKTIYGNK